MSNTQSQKLMVEWHSINWRKLERNVFKLQKRIYQASARGDVKAFRRPLGIPTMKDRALQALVKLALMPEWEARFEPN
ncbi:MAG: reverse transcriptase N-terminal domain-containing protein, partial [Nostoc sp.]